MNKLSETLINIRALLKKYKIDAFIIPTKDAHNSEYISKHDARREFVTGFSGSAGTAVVTLKRACLWVDGRYWFEAEENLDANFWDLVKIGQPEYIKMPNWINLYVPKKGVVGIDPFLTSAYEFKQWSKLSNRKFVTMSDNLIDMVWKDQPSQTANKIFFHPIEFSGETFQSKISRIRKILKDIDCDGIVITALDEIAWLFNLRGSDIPYNPVFYAYSIITQKNAILFIDDKKLSIEAKKHLLESKIIVYKYDYILLFCEKYNCQLVLEKKKIFMGTNCNYAIYSKFDQNVLYETKVSLIEHQKAIKNKTEIEGMINCHIRDGAAKTAWLAWLQESLCSGDDIDEISAASKLEVFRSKQKNFVSLSFDSISAIGGNAAVIHYKPTKKNNSKIDIEKLYLIDSGGQYRDGTTDVTRTVHFEQPSIEEIEYFTRVLKGHIALARCRFPENTTGSQIDALARVSLWQAGKNYMHGTGHGVGAFLNVHEGPQHISSSKNDSINLTSGMILSNEPGYYKKGEFGIRIESLMVVKKSSFKGFLEFETITMVPIQRKMINLELLNKDEILWLNEYHQTVLKNLTPLLKNDQRALDYLVKECAPIE